MRATARESLTGAERADPATGIGRREQWHAAQGPTAHRQQEALRDVVVVEQPFADGRDLCANTIELGAIEGDDSNADPRGSDKRTAIETNERTARPG